MKTKFFPLFLFIATALFAQPGPSGGTPVSPPAGSGPITSSGLTMTTARLLGRTTAGTGAVQELTAAAVQSFVGISIASGKTLTASNSITLAGTDSTTMTFPSTSATIARTDAAQTFTGTQTFTTISAPASTDLTLNAGSGGTNGVVINATSTGSITLSVAASSYIKIGTTPKILASWDANVNYIYGGSTNLTFRNQADSANWGKFDGNGMTILGSGGIQTTTPTSGTAAMWKLGSRVAATVAHDSTQYLQVDVAGVAYKVGLVQ